MLARCTSSLDLHMLIVPFWYLFRTLLVPKVALGYHRLIYTDVSIQTTNYFHEYSVKFATCVAEYECVSK